MRGFSTTSIRAGSIMPDGSAPDIKTNPKDAAMSSASCSVLELSDHQYHTLADQWIDDALTKLEELQDSRADIEVEYAAGVLSLSYGTVGTYVINKQPPNKQIWLSSPVSGPSRYDYVVFGDSQNEKEGTGRGAWMNMRDKRLLDDLLGEELGINFKVAIFSQ
jgi:frataxin